MFEGNECLGLLVKGCKHPPDKKGLGFKGKNAHYLLLGVLKENWM